MDYTSKNNIKDDALKFFKTYIYQFDIMLAGIMRPDFRKYIEEVKTYYSLAIKAIENEERDVANGYNNSTKEL